MLVSGQFANGANIFIPNPANPDPTSGPANPYPSAIAVSGLQGVVTFTALDFLGLNHTFPDDIDMLVESPVAGRNVIPISDAGNGSGVAGVNITINDNAAAPLPDNSQITSGLFQVSNFGGVDAFSAPAPAPSAFTTLAAAFNGINPNGTWNLYIEDDVGGDTGNLGAGWRLNFRTSIPVIDAGDFNGNGQNNGIPDQFRIVLNGPNLEVYLNGSLSRTQPFSEVTNIVVNGSNDNDTLIVDHSGGFINRPINFAGGGQTSAPFGDTLRMTGGVFTTVTYNHTNASSGSVNVDGSVVTYTGLEPIFDNMNAANRVFNFNNNPQTITLQNDIDQPGGPFGGMSQIASPGEAEIVFFNNPTTSLTVNGGSGGNTINVFPTIDPAFATPTTSINSGQGNDSVFVLQSALGTVINVDTQTGVPDRTVVGASSFVGNAGTGAGTLNNILGAINVTDSGGLGALMVDDSGNAGGGTYNFTATQINRGGAVINYTAAITPVQLATGSGADIVNVTGTTASVNTIFTNDGSDEVRVLAVSAGDELDIDTGFGSDAVVIGVGSSAAFNTGAGTLAPIQGNINLNDAGAATAFIDDSGDATARTFNFGDIGATPFFGGAGYQITSPAFLAGQISLTQIGFNGFQFAAGSGGDILNVNSTLSSQNVTTNVFFGNAGDDVFNIDGDGLRDSNTFNGGDGADTFNINVSGGADITAASLQINGDGAPAARRDQVVITHANARNFSFNYGAGPGEINVLGFATPINIDTAETVRLVGSGLDTATVNGLAGVDDTLTVNPVGTNDILVFRGGNPYDGSVRATHFSQAQLPGVAGGSTSPDLRLSFISQTGFTINGQGGDGLGPTDDRLFAYYSSDQALISNAEQAAGENSLGFGPGVLMPSFVTSANAVDDIQVFTAGDVITATRALFTPLVDVNVVAGSFVQPDVGQAGPPDDNPGVIVNSGHEAVPTVPDPQCGLRADFVTVNIAVAFPLSINGGDPLFNPAAPTQGDRIDFAVFVREINVFSDKQTPPNVTFEFIPFFGTLFDFQISGFECMGPLDAPIVNLIGDNNDPNRDQNDNFVVVGQDVDSGFPLFGDIDGTNEFVLRINGSPLIPFRNVEFLNVFGDDQNPPPGNPSRNTVAVELGDIDTLDLTPYADNADGPFPGGHPPRGWGIDVKFNEGDPVGTDGAQADLLIYHTSLGLGGAGSVSEDIVVQPSGPDNGEVRVTNATDGSVIVVVQYVANTDLIVVDDDGSLADTDSLTLRGTNPNGPQTSGNDTFTADFTAAGGVLTPQVIVTDPTNATPVLYRLRNFTGFNSINLAGLAGNDNFAVRNRAGLTVNIDGGDPVFSGDTLLYTAPTNATYSVGADPTTAHIFATGVGDTNLRNLEGVTINSLAAGSDLFVNATQGPDAFTLTTLGGAIPTVLLGARHQVGFNAGSTNFDSISMQGAGGDDTFEIVTPLVGVGITASGGAGIDRTNVFSTAAAEAATFTPINANNATLAIAGFGDIGLSNVENATYDGGPGANDSLTIAGTAVDDLTLVNPTSNGTGSFISNESPAFSFRSFLALTVNGGAGGTDTVEITGTEGIDTVSSDADTVFFLGAGNVTMINPTVDRMVLRTLGGNDIIDLDLTSAALAKTIETGAGNDMVNLTGSFDADIFGGIGDDILIGSPASDNIFGGPGNDRLIGAGGNDFLYGEEGNDRFGDLALGNGVADDPGNDHFFGGEGSDIFVWDPGDGSDTIEGGADQSDLMVFNGGATAEEFALSADGTKLVLTRDNNNDGSIEVIMTIAGVEDVDVNAMGGADELIVNDLYPTEVRDINLNLAPGDAAADSVRIEGRNVSDSVNLSAVGAVLNVTGLRYDVHVQGAVAGDGDSFVFNGNDGNDTIVAPLSAAESALVAAMFAAAVPPVAGNFTLNGNLGDDFITGYGDLNGNDGIDAGGADGNDTLIGGPLVNIIRGGGGNDLIHGGDSADSLFGDDGDDTFVPGFDNDTDSVNGGLGFDTILVQATSASERIDARQDAIGQISYEVQGINGGNGVIGILGGTETDVIVPGSVEELRIVAGSGDDNIRVAQVDSLVATPQFSLRFTVEGGPPGASDRLTVVDDGLGDTTIHRVGGIAGNGSYTVGLLAPVVYSDIEFASLSPINPITGGTGADGMGRLFVFKHDPFEENNDRTNATFLGSGASINTDPTIDPGFDALFGASGDEDWYRVVAQYTGDLDFRVFFRQQGTLDNGRAGLPGDGNLDIALYDIDGQPAEIAGTGAFGTNDDDDDERIRIPAVAGQTYYLRVRGAPLAAGDPAAINVYSLSVVNTPAAVPYDLELHDIIFPGTVTAGVSTTVFSGDAALPNVDDFFNGKVVSFKFDTTTAGLRGEEATVLDYVGATRTFTLAVPLSVTPAAGNTFQVESIDTGRNSTDNVTRDNTPTIIFRLDDAHFLFDLPGNDVPDSPPDEVIPIPFRPDPDGTGPLVPSLPGFAIAIFDEGTTPGGPTLTPPQTPIGFATFAGDFNNNGVLDAGEVMQPGVYQFTSPLLPDASHFITARVQMIDPSSGGGFGGGGGGGAGSGAVIIDGGDRDEHGTRLVGPDLLLGTPDDVNVDGWQYIQQMVNFANTGHLNAGTGILAIGASGNAALAIQSTATVLGIPITFVTGAAITAANFPDFAVIYVPSDLGDTAGGISDADLALLTARKLDVQNFVNTGGSLVALTQQAAATPYSWLELPDPFTIGSPSNSVEQFQTPALAAAGLIITNAELENGTPLHNTFTGPAGFNGLAPFVLGPGPDGLENTADDQVITLGLAPGSIGIGADLVTGFGARSLSLEIDLDTVEPPVAFGDPGAIGDGLIDDSDSFVIPNPHTIFDLITNDLTPTFWGRAEANATVRLYADTFRDLDADGVFDFVDVNGDGDFDPGTDIAIDTEPNGILEPNLDIFIGQTTAIPLDGNQQEPDGFWQLQSVVNFNDPRFFIGLGGVRTVFATAEDVAGNVNGDELPEQIDLDIFIDVQGPQITDVEINEAGNPYDLFDPKPSNDGPTPLVNSLVISVRDLPPRVQGFLFPAIKEDIAENPGHYLVRGDYNGIIPILRVDVDAPVPADPGPPPAEVVATATIEIVFRDAGLDGVFNTPDDIGKPLPDDRFTLFINDEGIVDFAGNILDGESNADEPHDQDAADPDILGVDGFPTGDGVPGGDFIARFTVDSRPEVAVWAAGSAWVDTNGNNQFDQNNLDFTNRDITYVLGLTSDDLFAGNFAANVNDPLTPDDERIADGFDKLAAYGRYNGTFRFLIDTDNDGVPNIEASQGAAGVNGLPVAGRFDGNAANGDEVAIFNGARWFFDTDHDFSVVDAGGSATINWPVAGYPIVGDFDGDGLDDLATWTDDVFSFDLSSVGAATGPLAGNARINGTIDRSFKFGFIGPGERPVAADMNQDDIEDVGLFVPARDGVPPTEGAEWYFLISGMVANNTPNQPGNNPAAGQAIGPSITGGAYPIAADGPGDFLSEATYGFAGDTYERGRIVIDPLLAQNIVRFDPTPFGNDQYIQYGDSFALPIVGNFDPPVTQSGTVGTPQRDPLDVNSDGFISPIDALLVVNFLNATSEPNPAAPSVGAEGPYIDVNDDGFISPLDALLVVNYLNATSASGGEGEAEGEAVDAVFSDYDPAEALLDLLVTDSHKARKRR